MMNGHAVVVDQLARQFVQMGHEVVVVARSKKRKAIIDAFSKTPYRLKQFSESHFEWLERRRLRRQLVKLHRSWAFDILHCSSIYPAGFAAKQFCDDWPGPFTVGSQGGDFAEESSFRRDPRSVLRIREALDRADAIVAISPHIKEQELAAAPNCGERIREIPNGVDYMLHSTRVDLHKAEWSHFQKKPFILFLGRLDSRKGASFLIQAFYRIANQIPDAHLVLAGSGHEARYLKASTEARNLNGRIHFIGPAFGVEKLWLLQNAKCVAVPTVSWEGLPLVALEAMACGQWVIGTRVGGIVGLIEPDENGFLVPPSDAAALADALLVPFKNPAMREQISSAASKKAQQHDWATVARRHVALFEELIAQKMKTIPIESSALT